MLFIQFCRIVIFAYSTKSRKEVSFACRNQCPKKWYCPQKSELNFQSKNQGNQMRRFCFSFHCVYHFYQYRVLKIFIFCTWTHLNFNQLSKENVFLKHSFILVTAVKAKVLNCPFCHQLDRRSFKFGWVCLQYPMTEIRKLFHPLIKLPPLLRPL